MGFSGVAIDPDVPFEGDGGLTNCSWIEPSAFMAATKTFASDKLFVRNVLNSRLY